MRINSEIERFLFAPEKPLILSIGRADKRKNFETIITSYGQDKELQTMANLAIFAGVRKDISLMPPDEQETLTNLLLLMDKYDLYGQNGISRKKMIPFMKYRRFTGWPHEKKELLSMLHPVKILG
ncbi:MAG: hypothetical protein LRY55_04120 [Leadbetterella sp.]|nr:hypothetical protein [Leadbetterella sp.]